MSLTTNIYTVIIGLLPFCLVAQDRISITFNDQDKINVEDSIKIGFGVSDTSVIFQSLDETQVVRLSPSDSFVVTDKRVYKDNFEFKLTPGNFKIIRVNQQTGRPDEITFKFETKPPDPPKDPVSVNSPTSIFFDALTLADPNRDKRERMKVISRYSSTLKVNKNPFFNQDINGLINEGLRATGPKVEGGLFSAVGGLDVTKYVDGLAKFLVKRTKEELNIAFFEKFTEAIENNADLKDLFPQTAGTLELIGEEIYDYQQYLTTLREQFETDLKNLPENFPKIVDNHTLFFDAHPGVRTLLYASSDLVIDIRDGAHPGDALKNFETSGLEQIDTSLRAAIETVQLFSEALRDTSTADDGHFWVSEDKINALFRDQHKTMVFLGLILEKAEEDSIKFDNKFLHEALSEAGTLFTQYYPKYSTFFLKLAQDIDNLNMLISKQKASEQDLTLTGFFQFFNSAINMVEAAEELPSLFPAIKINVQEIERAVAVSRNFSQLVVNVAEAKYGAAVINVVSLYNEVISKTYNSEPDVFGKSIDKKKFEALWKDAKKILGQIKSGNTEAILADAKSLDFKTLTEKYGSVLGSGIKGNLDTIYLYSQQEWIEDGAAQIKSKLLRYATFMAAIIQAQDSDQVAAAIEAYALPSGSARIKRKSRRSISLNAYVGPFGGWEFAQDTLEGTGVIGLTAPVGVAFSKGRIYDDQNGSISLFFSLIDIGAVVSYRFKDNESESPKIFLREIFSPGVYLSHSAGKVLSINVGYQYAPRLKRIGSMDSEVDLSYRGRLSASLVVDIPMINFYTKTD